MEKLYNGVNHAYMTYFVDAIFQLLNSIDDGDGFEWNYCKLNYRVIGDEYKKELEFLDKMYGISGNIPIYQKSLFKMVEQYLI